MKVYFTESRTTMRFIQITIILLGTGPFLEIICGFLGIRCWGTHWNHVHKGYIYLRQTIHLRQNLTRCQSQMWRKNHQPITHSLRHHRLTQALIHQLTTTRSKFTAPHNPWTNPYHIPQFHIKTTPNEVIMEKPPKPLTVHTMISIQVKIPIKPTTQTNWNTHHSIYLPPSFVPYPDTNCQPQWPVQQSTVLESLDAELHNDDLFNNLWTNLTQQMKNLAQYEDIVQPRVTVESDQAKTHGHVKAEEQPQPIRGRPARNIIEKICVTGTCNLNRYWRGKKK